MIVALLIIAFIVFVVSVMEGYVDLESKDRVERWVGMRAGGDGEE